VDNPDQKSGSTNPTPCHSTAKDAIQNAKGINYNELINEFEIEKSKCASANVHLKRK